MVGQTSLGNPIFTSYLSGVDMQHSPEDETEAKTSRKISGQNFFPHLETNIQKEIYMFALTSFFLPWDFITC